MNANNRKHINSQRMSFMLMIAVLLVSALCATVEAANTKDDDITAFSATVIGYHAMDNSYARDKTDYSPVYLYITSSTKNSVRVRALGATTKLGSYSNYTWANGAATSYVTCSKNVPYKIHSVILERAEAAGYSKAWAKLSFHSPYITTNYIYGKWSPDCTNNSSYTDATP